MKTPRPLSPAKDKPLFTPGPLTTSQDVKLAMLRDLGSRDGAFIGAVRRIRDGLLRVAGVSKATGHEAILVQGSGTFGLESVISSAVPENGKLLVIINGAYGRRLAQIGRIHRIPTEELVVPEHRSPSPNAVAERLAADRGITHVVAVHCETTTGIFNPITPIGRVVAEHGRRYIVDSMSAFGAVPFDFQGSSIDFLVSSANKCIEGVPGFSFVICRRDALLETEGRARTLSLDLLAQWKGLEKDGQFRFTPPTHAILAFERALEELDEEGGVVGRAERYQRNHQVTREGLRALGFREYLSPELQGWIITSFRYPEDPRFRFDEFYDRLNEKGYVIYPGKVSDADCFRIGHIGRLFESDMKALIGAIGETVRELGLRLG
jgi:2-aminoethylphosphonate-pyruvate transaminase